MILKCYKNCITLSKKTKKEVKLITSFYFIFFYIYKFFFKTKIAEETLLFLFYLILSKGFFKTPSNNAPTMEPISNDTKYIIGLDMVGSTNIPP